MNCVRCGVERATINLFCECGKLYSRSELQQVRIPGFVGVHNSTSDTIDQFWRSGDPSVFAKKNSR